jgi:hypothetical protein
MKHFYLILLISIGSLSYGFGQCNAAFTKFEDNCNQTVKFVADNYNINTTGLTYTWNFNGTTIVATTDTMYFTFPTVSGPNSDNYSVTLTVAGDTSCSNPNSTETQIVTISQVPDASFTSTVPSCNQTANFSHTNPSTNYTHEWDFGDGGISTQQSPSHIYPLIKGGSTTSYTVRLIVTGAANAGSCKDTVTHTVDIDEIPIAGLKNEDALLDDYEFIH